MADAGAKDEAYEELAAKLSELHGTVATFTQHMEGLVEMGEQTTNLALRFDSM
jgi:hypothetical protein